MTEPSSAFVSLSLIPKERPEFESVRIAGREISKSRGRTSALTFLASKLSRNRLETRFFTSEFS